MTTQYDDLLRRILEESLKTERRKYFIFYYHGDQTAVDAFVESFEDILIPKAIGISEEDDYTDSDNPEYVMSRIRQDVLGDSTVTICLIGQCTHSRRYIDSELKASLRQGDDYDPNGLIGILLPHISTSGHLPDRFKENWGQDSSKFYVIHRSYPTDAEQLRRWIEDAYARRTTQAKYICNSRDMMKYNAKCWIHSVAH